MHLFEDSITHLASNIVKVDVYSIRSSFSQSGLNVLTLVINGRIKT